MEKNLVVVVSWDLNDMYDSFSGSMSRKEQDAFHAKSSRLDSLIMRDLSKALGGARVDGPHAGDIGDTYAYFEADSWELASEFVLEHWGDADGGDLLVHGALSEEVDDLVYELERAAGVSEHDEPLMMFRIAMDEVQITSWSREEGFTTLYRVEPLQGDEDEFVEALQEHFGV